MVDLAVHSFLERRDASAGTDHLTRKEGLLAPLGVAALPLETGVLGRAEMGVPWGVVGVRAGYGVGVGVGFSPVGMPDAERAVGPLVLALGDSGVAVPFLVQNLHLQGV